MNEEKSIMLVTWVEQETPEPCPSCGLHRAAYYFQEAEDPEDEEFEYETPSFVYCHYCKYRSNVEGARYTLTDDFIEEILDKLGESEEIEV